MFSYRTDSKMNKAEDGADDVEEGPHHDVGNLLL